MSNKSGTKLTSKQRELLRKVYFRDRNYFGRDKLYAYLRAYYPDSKISKRMVMSWLKEQNVAQLYRPTRKTKNIASTVLSRPLQQIGIDLVDMQTMKHNGMQYILTAQDLFSKKAWAVALPDKKGSTVARGMKTILDSMGSHKPTSIRSDNGSEFISRPFKTLLSKHGIKQVLSNPAAPQSNGQIERFNSTLKRMIKMDRTQTDSPNWPKILPTLIRNFNNVPSATTGEIPNDVKVTSKTDKVLEQHKQIKTKIAKTVRPKNESATHPQKAKFSQGDQVRLKMKTPANYKKDELWSRDLYQIAKVFHPKKPFVAPSYQIRNRETGETYRDRHYEADLQKVSSQVRNKVRAPKKFIISKILQRRKRRNREPEYLVQWTGYRGQDSWEPESNLKRDVPKMLTAFQKGQKKTGR